MNPYSYDDYARWRRAELLADAEACRCAGQARAIARAARRHRAGEADSVPSESVQRHVVPQPRWQLVTVRIAGAAAHLLLHVRLAARRAGGGQSHPA